MMILNLLTLVNCEFHSVVVVEDVLSLWIQDWEKLQVWTSLRTFASYANIRTDVSRFYDVIKGSKFVDLQLFKVFHDISLSTEILLLELKMLLET